MAHVLWFDKQHNSILVYLAINAVCAFLELVWIEFIHTLFSSKVAWILVGFKSELCN